MGCNGTRTCILQTVVRKPCMNLADNSHVTKDAQVLWLKKKNQLITCKICFTRFYYWLQGPLKYCPTWPVLSVAKAGPVTCGGLKRYSALSVLSVMNLALFWQNETHKRFKRTVFIRPKHNMRILGVILFILLQNDTLPTDKRWKTMKNAMLLSRPVVFCPNKERVNFLWLWVLF